MKFTINGQEFEHDGDPDMPLLWYLRDHLKLIGTKFGCGIGSCGACTVHVNGSAARSCSLPMSGLANSSITTIEALADDASSDARLNPVQQAWLELDVPQCGYCQAGQIMAVTDLLQRIPSPTDDEIDQNLNNLCRCGTYTRIRAAIHRAAQIKQSREISVGGES